jgi:hypothetical protein
MAIELNEVLSLLKDDEIELIRSVAINTLIVRCYESIRGPLSGDATIDVGSITRGAIMQKIPGEIEGSLRDLVIDRLEYWASMEAACEWSTEVGIARVRKSSFRKYKGETDVCEWPGCSVTSGLVSDHRFPFSLGGGDEKWNHGPLCRWHNLIKMNSPYLIVHWPEVEL